MKVTKLLLIVIILLAFTLRVYKLDSVPPSISWDEAAFGYNAWTIANYGRDEYGKFFPLYFKSFGDDKHPVHIYITAIFVKLLGLNEFSTRLPSAVFGTLNVLLIYFLGKLFFKKEMIAFSATLFLAISPYNIHFSRFNHEANFALFFLMLALVLFFYSIKKHKKILVFSALSFAICLLTYHSAKIVVPLIVLFLFIMYCREILRDRADFILSIFVATILLVTIFLNPQLLGIARVSQTSLSSEAAKETNLYEITKNEFLGKINLVSIQYSWHFMPQFLFITGDKNPKLSSQTGEFYKIDALFLIIGVISLLYKKSREGVSLLLWALIAPIPSSLVAESPHAARASFMMGSWHLISALGFYTLLIFFKNYYLKIGAFLIIISFLTISLFGYLNYYFGEYTKRYAIEWQYGMKQIVEYVKDHPEYHEIYVTDVRSQPYIYFIYYLQTPLPDYLNTVLYNRSETNKSYNLVSYFDKYYFGGWDIVESMPNKGVLYIVTSSQYDGLKYRELFDIKRIIYYPNGTSAFYLVSAP